MNGLKSLLPSSLSKIIPPRRAIAVVTFATIAIVVAGFLAYPDSKPRHRPPLPPQQTTLSQPDSASVESTASGESTSAAPSDAAPVVATEVDPTADSSHDDDTQPADSSPAQAEDPVLASMTITPGTVAPSGSFTIDVTISSPAPSGGVSVDVKIDDVPQNPIVIGEGDTSASVDGTAGTESSKIDCTYAGVTYEAELTISDSDTSIPFCDQLIGASDDRPCADPDTGDQTTLEEWRDYKQRVQQREDDEEEQHKQDMQND